MTDVDHDMGGDANAQPPVQPAPLLPLDQIFRSGVAHAPLLYHPPITGASRPWLLRNQTAANVKLMTEHKETSMCVVITRPGFKDRVSGPAWFRKGLADARIPHAGQMHFSPPTQLVESTSTPGATLDAPVGWVAYNIHPETRSILERKPWFTTVIDNHALTYAFLSCDPDTPHLVFVFVGCIPDTPPTLLIDCFKAALQANAAARAAIMADLSNLRPGNHTWESVLDAMFRGATITAREILPQKPSRTRGIPHGPPPRLAIPAFVLTLVPHSLIHEVNLATCRLVMVNTFSFDVPLYGRAQPWVGHDLANPMLMDCSICWSTDHYKNNCHIYNEPSYRDAHNIPSNNNTNLPLAEVSNTLSFVPVAQNNAPHQQFNNFRGGARGGGAGYRGARYAPYGGSSRGGHWW